MVFIIPQTFQAVRLLGQLQHGVYADEWEDIEKETLQAELGTNVPPDHPPHHGPAGTTDISDDSEEGSNNEGKSDNSNDLEGNHESDEDSTAGEFPSDSSNVSSLDVPLSIRQRIQEEIRHRPVKALRVGDPLDVDRQKVLFERIVRWTDRQYTPAVHGLRHDDHNYLAAAEIQVGRRKDRYEQITLPEDIWLPRTLLWLRAVVALTRMEDREE